MKEVCEETSFIIRNGEFHQISLDKLIYLTIHHAIHVGGLVIGTMVFHPSIIEDVASYLTSPFYFLLASLYLSLCFQSLFHGSIIEL